MELATREKMEVFVAMSESDVTRQKKRRRWAFFWVFITGIVVGFWLAARLYGG